MCFALREKKERARPEIATERIKIFRRLSVAVVPRSLSHLRARLVKIDNYEVRFAFERKSESSSLFLERRVRMFRRGLLIRVGVRVLRARN